MRGKAPVYLPQNTATTAVFSRAAIAPALSGADASGESSTAPRKALSASASTIGCGAARTTPATRLGSAAIGATRPARPPSRSKAGPPPPLFSSEATTIGFSASPPSVAGIAATRRLRSR